MISQAAPLLPVATTFRARAALAAAGVVLFYTGLDNYAFQSWSWPAPITFIWLFLVAAAAIAIVDARAPMPVLGSPFLLWVFFYFVITTIWALWAVGGAAEVDALRERYRSVGFMLAFAIIFDDARARRVGAISLAAAVIANSCINMAEMFGLARFAIEEGRVAGRAAGIYVNANGAALAIVLGLAVVIHRVQVSYRIPFVLIGAAGVAATFSRGAAIVYAALVLYLGATRQLGRRPVVLTLLGLGLLIAAQLDAARLLDAQGILTPETLARLRLTQDDSGRQQLALSAWRDFLESPLAGHGVGATKSAHNQLLALAGDHGILGLLAFPALVLVLARNPGARALALALLLMGLFSHNLLDDRASLLVIALAGARGSLGVDAADSLPPRPGGAESTLRSARR